MRTTTMLHCENESTVKMRLSEISDLGDCEYRTLDIGDVTIFITKDQAEQLCEVIEKTLYDEPTYKELNTICMNQQMRIEELEEKLREKESSSYEHMAFQDVI